MIIPVHSAYPPKGFPKSNKPETNRTENSWEMETMFNSTKKNSYLHGIKREGSYGIEHFKITFGNTTLLIPLSHLV